MERSLHLGSIEGGERNDGPASQLRPAGLYEVEECGDGPLITDRSESGDGGFSNERVALGGGSLEQEGDRSRVGDLAQRGYGGLDHPGRRILGCLRHRVVAGPAQRAEGLGRLRTNLLVLV